MYVEFIDEVEFDKEWIKNTLINAHNIEWLDSSHPYYILLGFRLLSFAVNEMFQPDTVKQWKKFPEDVVSETVGAFVIPDLWQDQINMRHSHFLNADMFCEKCAVTSCEDFVGNLISNRPPIYVIPRCKNLFMSLQAIVPANFVLWQHTPKCCYWCGFLMEPIDWHPNTVNDKDSFVAYTDENEPLKLALNEPFWLSYKNIFIENPAQVVSKDVSSYQLITHQKYSWRSTVIVSPLQKKGRINEVMEGLSVLTRCYYALAGSVHDFVRLRERYSRWVDALFSDTEDASDYDERYIGNALISVFDTYRLSDEDREMVVGLIKQRYC